MKILTLIIITLFIWSCKSKSNDVDNKTIVTNPINSIEDEVQYDKIVIIRGNHLKRGCNDTLEICSDIATINFCDNSKNISKLNSDITQSNLLNFKYKLNEFSSIYKTPMIKDIPSDKMTYFSYSIRLYSKKMLLKSYFLEHVMTDYSLLADSTGATIMNTINLIFYKADSLTGNINNGW